MEKLIINKNDAGQRIEKFTAKYYYNMPKSLIFKALRTKKIKINGKRATLGQTLLEGDEVAFYINFAAEKKAPEFIENPAIDIVYEDENILLVNKKSGQLVYDGSDNKNDSLLCHIKSYLNKKGEYLPEKEHSFAPSLCNRIDRNTSGIVIVAKNAPALREMNEKIKNNEISKYYICMAEGIFKKKEGKICTYLAKNEKSNTVFVCDKNAEGAKYAETHYRVLKEKNNTSLVEVLIVTGRSHQIRVHFKSISHPLCGDVKYGAQKNKQSTYQALCSYKLKFNFGNDTNVLKNLMGKEFSLSPLPFGELFES